MFRAVNDRLSHYALLSAVAALLFLPGLGHPSLWDIDEGHNAQAAYEMFEAGNWIVPTFNGKLRVDKPALLYWLQIFAYQLFGVGEFAGRLPSALAAMLAVLFTYELGRRLFDAATGFFAGVVLASAGLFCGSAHFANPDALLNACTVLTFLFFWRGFVRGDASWLCWIGLSTGLGFLAKGPVAVVLPSTVIGLFLLWSGQLRRLATWRLPIGLLVLALVIMPWFALVGSETKGEYLRGFFLTHNFLRFSRPMEGHQGPFFYHVVSLLVGFLPWSVLLGPAFWYAWYETGTGSDAETRGHGDAEKANDMSPRRRVAVWPCRFLLCWIAVYLIFFSISQTKLPNYILPLYPAVALLTARFLQRWRRGDIEAPRFMMPGILLCLGFVGVGLAALFLVGSGVIELRLLRGRYLPGLEHGVWLGLLPVVGAFAAWVCLRRQSRSGVVTCITVTVLVFVAVLTLWIGPVVDAQKAPRVLVQAAHVRQLERDVRVGCYEYYQPSLVFYCGREVSQLLNEREALDFLQSPLEVYLFVPADLWRMMAAKSPASYRLLATHYCVYRHCEVAVVTNK
jgi:4-amino-4-deoxy-L-arabinose transferase-like glycosyltransferase